jgi:hypothetical protein
MKKVKFVKELYIEERPFYDIDEPIRSVSIKNLNSVNDGDNGSGLLHTKEEIKTEIVPIYRIFNHEYGCDPKDVYIAYSMDVEQLLELPFKAMKADLKYYTSINSDLNHKVEELRYDLKQEKIKFEEFKYFINTMSFWDKLKSLFHRRQYV